jgi:hypothetical protein
MATVDAFLEGTVGALDTPGDIVLDLTKLTFMDSSGLQAVVALARRVDGGVRPSLPTGERAACPRHPGRQWPVGIRIEG